MLRLSPRAVSELYDKDLIAFGTGNYGKRIIPYLAQDPNIRLLGVTNSRVTADDDGTFLETGLPIRSIHAWAKHSPNATILVTSFMGMNDITAISRKAGFRDFKFITGEMLDELIKKEEQIAESRLTQIFTHLCLANELQDAHKTAFSEFKACNRGRTVAVVGTGPSLSYYTQIPGVSHIGVNSSFLRKDLTLKYYFLLHYMPDWCEKLKEYSFVKFFGVNRNVNSKDQFPEYILEENGGRCFFSMNNIPGTQIHTDIEHYPLMSYDSVIFRAIHFALYTRPKRLMLVGCDCTANGHFDGEAFGEYNDVHIPRWLAGYRDVKKFVSIHYPDTEIISVNPVGLKGMFHDMYTESYLEAHPEIDRAECEIADDLL